MTDWRCPSCGKPSDYKIDPETRQERATLCTDCYKAERIAAVQAKGSGFNSLAWADATRGGRR